MLWIDLEWVGMRIATGKEPTAIKKPRTTAMPFGPTYCKFIGDVRRINCGAVYVEISSRPETGQSHMTVPHLFIEECGYQERLRQKLHTNRIAPHLYVSNSDFTLIVRA